MRDKRTGQWYKEFRDDVCNEPRYEEIPNLGGDYEDLGTVQYERDLYKEYGLRVEQRQYNKKVKLCLDGVL